MPNLDHVTSLGRRLGACLVAFALVLGLAACAAEFDDGEDDDPYETASATSAATTNASTSQAATTASSNLPSTWDTAEDEDDAAATTGSVVQASEGEVAPAKDGIAYFGPESGGTANPNDRPLPLMYFESHGVNPFIDADEDPLSTFALDGDTASYEILGLYLGQLQLPPP